MGLARERKHPQCRADQSGGGNYAGVTRKLGRAMALRETLQDILADEDEESLRWWIRRAKVSRLEPFRKLAFCFQENWAGIIALVKTRG